MYFKVDRLRPTSSKQSMSFFEKIRTVGKGAYGSAVLYRKKDDSSLVILKEINMHDLNAAERQMALNEVDFKTLANSKILNGLNLTALCNFMSAGTEIISRWQKIKYQLHLSQM